MEKNIFVLFFFLYGTSFTLISHSLLLHPTKQRRTLHLRPKSVVIIGLILNWHPFWKVKLCAWLVILDDCFVVCHGSISCFGEGAEVFAFAIKVDLCYELLSELAHSIKTCLVV